MIKIWKSYAVFSSWIYRLMTLLVIPVVFIVGEFELFTLVNENTLMVGFKVFVGLILTYEVINDYWLLGGICSHDGCCIESLKLAETGKHVLGDALVMDLIRRFVYLLGVGVIAYVKTGMFSLLLTAMTGYIALIIMLNVTRYMSTFLLQISMSQVAVVLYSLIMLLGSDFETMESAGLRGAILMLLLVVSAVLGVVTVIHVLGRWKESYYEK